MDDTLRYGKMKHESLNENEFVSGCGIIPNHPQLIQPMVPLDIMQLDRNDRLKLAIEELRIGACIRAELKRQGRTVSWLAKQLCMERTGLYYTFRQSSINTELLLRISCCLEHNFFKDVSDAYEAFGL